MPEKNPTKKCDGCGQPIGDGETDIVLVYVGKAEWDSDPATMLVQPEEDLWFGHRKCYDSR